MSGLRSDIGAHAVGADLFALVLAGQDTGSRAAAADTVDTLLAAHVRDPASSRHIDTGRTGRTCSPGAPAGSVQALPVQMSTIGSAGAARETRAQVQVSHDGRARPAHRR